jgi:hypothetical protein
MDGIPLISFFVQSFSNYQISHVLALYAKVKYRLLHMLLDILPHESQYSVKTFYFLSWLL